MEGCLSAFGRPSARIAGALTDLKWADCLTRIYAQVGGNREKVAALRARLMDAGVGAGVNLASARYGRHFRQLVGPRIGRIEITPGRTEAGHASPDNSIVTPWTDEAPSAAVEQHNAEVLVETGAASGRSVLPEGLERAGIADGRIGGHHRIVPTEVGFRRV